MQFHWHFRVNHSHEKLLSAFFFCSSLAQNSVCGVNAHILEKCLQIKKLKLYDEEKKYVAVVNNLYKNNLNVQCCIDYFLEEKEKKVEKFFEKKYKIPADVWQRQKKIVHESKSAENSIIYDQNVPITVQMNITFVAHRQSLHESIRVKNDVKRTDAYAYVMLSPDTVARRDKNNTIFIDDLKWDLYLTPLYYKLSASCQYAVLLHEFEHIKQRHPYKELLLIDFIKRKSCVPLTANDKEIFTKFFEAEANRKPAASGKWQDAVMLYEIHDEILTTIPIIGRKFFLKNWNWALKIAKLKRAEEIVRRFHIKDEKTSI